MRSMNYLPGDLARYLEEEDRPLGLVGLYVFNYRRAAFGRQVLGWHYDELESLRRRCFPQWMRDWRTCYKFEDVIEPLHAIMYGRPLDSPRWSITLCFTTMFCGPYRDYATRCCRQLATSPGHFKLAQQYCRSLPFLRYISRVNAELGIILAPHITDVEYLIATQNIPNIQLIWTSFSPKVWIGECLEQGAHDVLTQIMETPEFQESLSKFAVELTQLFKGTLTMK